MGIISLLYLLFVNFFIYINIFVYKKYKSLLNDVCIMLKDSFSYLSLGIRN